MKLHVLRLCVVSKTLRLWTLRFHVCLSRAPSTTTPLLNVPALRVQCVMRRCKFDGRYRKPCEILWHALLLCGVSKGGYVQFVCESLLDPQTPEVF